MRFVLTLLLFCLSAGTSSLKAQELNCRVSINSALIQTSDRQIFNSMQSSITEFMNNRKWTPDVFSNQERINCNIAVTIKERISISQYKGSAQIQCERPVYGTAYNSVLINLVDNDWEFEYNEFQTLEFTENTKPQNLAGLLAYYAYIVLGFDYDSFSKFGGNPYFQKAQNLVNLHQNAPESGWKSFEGIKNRYWLAENLTNKSFMPFREAYYLFHRKAMDEFIGNEDNGRATVLECLKKIQKVNYDKPGSMLIRIFFDAKADELVNIFSKSNPGDKQTALNILNEIDPPNGSKYEKIMKQ